MALDCNIRSRPGLAVPRLEGMRSGGKFAWATAAVEWLMHGQSVAAVNHARLLIGEERVIRIQHEARPGLYQLDGYTSALGLEGVGHELARKYAPTVIRQFLSVPDTAFLPFFRID
jgi:hypothetical protein